MNILISGASGLLGEALVRLGTVLGHACTALNRNLINLGDAASTSQFFEGYDLFIHAAANTNVEYCEAYPDQCYRDNFLLTQVLSLAACKLNVPIVYISSTGIYGSRKLIPYREYDEVFPETHHHKSKKLAEDFVLRISPENLVVRTGWLFGGAKETKKNFVANRILEASNTKTGIIYSNNEQRGCPSFADDVCSRIFELIEIKHTGIFNVVNSGNASRFEYVSQIIAMRNIMVNVHPQPASVFNRIAPVSNNEMALNWRSDEYKFSPMRSWQDALSAYVKSFYITY